MPHVSLIMFDHCRLDQMALLRETGQDQLSVSPQIRRLFHNPNLGVCYCHQHRQAGTGNSLNRLLHGVTIDQSHKSRNAPAVWETELLKHLPENRSLLYMLYVLYRIPLTQANFLLAQVKISLSMVSVSFPHCTCLIWSHNALFRTDIYTFLFWIVHSGIWDRCIVVFVI